MDAREHFHAMLAKREVLRASSREAYEVVRFQEFLQQLANPYMKTKPKKPEDVVKFIWEMEKKQPMEEMKQVLKTIASTNFAKKHPPKIRTSPPLIVVERKQKKKGP